MLLQRCATTDRKLLSCSDNAEEGEGFSLRIQGKRDITFLRVCACCDMSLLSKIYFGKQGIVSLCLCVYLRVMKITRDHAYPVKCLLLNFVGLRFGLKINLKIILC